MPQLENIEAIEKRLWKAADTLRANSNYASNEYFLPVMGLVFLRHAYNRYLTVREQIEGTLPSRGGKVRALKKEDFSQKSSIFLRDEAQFDYLASLPDHEDRAQRIIAAMESIEEDYESLRGVLPKQEYQELDNDLLASLLRTLNPDELKRADGDIFGRIYEYFLTQFADQKAHDGGEFFTPISIVSLIANVLEPEHGKVLDPACGSGGMFVQSARFVERMEADPSERLAFYGLEKNSTTIRLAKMNLAVHGLEGDIQKAITYYEDPHELFQKADYVMANPPFNVDEVDAGKVKRDPRLPFGLPGVNKEGKVSNGNYLWISYFYSYLNERGRAGFVMSSQASSAGRGEAKVRQKLVESGAVDVMIAIRSNFFYTRSVPCELWFLNRGKPEAMRDKVLMIDARNVYRKVTRKINDFSPEQLQNILSIVWLYRGQSDRFVELLASYLDRTLAEGDGCFALAVDGETLHPIPDFMDALAALDKAIAPFIKIQAKGGAQAEPLAAFAEAKATFEHDVAAFRKALEKEAAAWSKAKRTLAAVKKAADPLGALAEQSRNLGKQADQLVKLALRVVDVCEKELDAKASDAWATREVSSARKAADEARQVAVEQLRQVRYVHRQARWLLDRFPEGELADVEGLVKVVDAGTLKEHDWSLTPGRYVGVAPEEEDEDFDFEETLREIHIELEGLNEEAAQLAATIKKNFEGLGA